MPRLIASILAIHLQLSLFIKTLERERVSEKDLKGLERGYLTQPVYKQKILFNSIFFPKPIPRLLSIPKIYETDTDTFSDTKFLQNPIPILFSIPKIFETNTDTIKKVSKPKCHTLLWKNAP